jgi:BMFP domain-containing protein YqiC
MDSANINVRAVRDALPHDTASTARLRAENATLTARVRELEEQLRRERSRSDGLGRGVAALSDTVTTLRGTTA